MIHILQLSIFKFKDLGEDDFKYFSQEFDSNILDFAKQKGFYPYEYEWF